MEQFLLIIILVLLLAAVFIVHIIRLVFRFSHPIYPTNLPVRDERNRSGSGGGLGIFIFILLLGIAYLSFEGKIRSEPPKLPEISEKKQVPNPPIVKRDTVYISPYSRVKEDVENPNFVLKDSMVDSKTADNSWEIDRYNQHPGNSLPSNYFALQVGAYENESFAIEKAEEWSRKFDNIKIIYINEKAPFKLIFGPFNTRKEAQDFKRRNGIKDGFPRLIDHY